MIRSRHNFADGRGTRPFHGRSVAAFSNVCLAVALLSGTGAIREHRDLPDTMPMFPGANGRILPKDITDSLYPTRATDTAPAAKPDLMPYYPHTQGAGARFVCPALLASAPLLPSRGLPGMERSVPEDEAAPAGTAARTGMPANRPR